jgi:hypothetical protein
MIWARVLPFFFLFGTISASAESPCALKGINPAGVRNGLLLFRDNGRWREFSSFESLNLQVPRTIIFNYVVTPAPDDRSGVIVIKSARKGPPLAGDARVGSVLLIRQQRATKLECSAVGFGGGTVSSRAYDDYHDLGYKDTKALRAEGQIIHAFHTTYSTNRGCRGTDDINKASGDFEYRNNRSQFSYNTGIVDSGWNTSLYTLATGLVPSAFANSSQFSEQRTEIKRYHAVGGPSCIQFSIRAYGPNQILRINDLESASRNVPGPGSEQRWER